MPARARLAEACADCHAEAGVIPEFRSAKRVPPDQPTIEARMARHLWATDRLWEGIVGAADESWRDGLDVLAAAPLDAPQITGERSTFARQLQQQADRRPHARVRRDPRHVHRLSRGAARRVVR